MVTKGIKNLLAEANAAIHTMDAGEAIGRHAAGDALFVDVRETQEWMQAHVEGAVHAPRGFLEFIADPESPMHKDEFASGKDLIVYCASGGRSALAAKTLVDMGFSNVSHVAGGLQAWMAAGGPVQT